MSCRNCNCDKCRKENKHHNLANKSNKSNIVFVLNHLGHNIFKNEVLGIFSTDAKDLNFLAEICSCIRINF